VCRVSLDVRADKYAPWHPGRCAAIYARVASDAGEWLAGHAGELHPRVIQAFGLPERTCAMELDLSVVFAAAEGRGAVQAPELSGYPLATQDVALIVDAAVPAAEVEAALVAGAPRDLLEDIRLFDVYTGAQVGQDRKSLAYTLRFRAPDRTLTAAEATAARDSAVAEATRRVGATLRTA
jgi:phenylalanyl-tRNA synthetase beta chain